MATLWACNSAAIAVGDASGTVMKISWSRRSEQRDESSVVGGRSNALIPGLRDGGEGDRTTFPCGGNENEEVFEV